MGEEFGPIDASVAEPVYYFCLDHHLVEGADGCRGEVRLGPYPTFDAASSALETAQRRTEAWDDEDEAWDAPKPPP
jgi:hypothetical protein